MVNQELAALVHKQVTTHPDTYNQGTWATRRSPAQQQELGISCGTQMCIAGWAVQLGDPGSQPVWSFASGCPVNSAYSVELSDGTVQEYRRAAQAMLGIGSVAASYLFSANRSEDEAVRALKELADTGKLTTLEYYDHAVFS